DRRAELAHQRQRALRLPRREVVHARVVRVVHEVLDGVGAAGGAGVPAGGAAEGRGGLGGGVADAVAAGLAAGRRIPATAAAVEGVEEADVVADLVGAGVALVVGEEAAARERVVVEDDAGVDP